MAVKSTHENAASHRVVCDKQCLLHAKCILNLLLSEVLSRPALRFCRCSARTTRLTGSARDKINLCFAGRWSRERKPSCLAVGLEVHIYFTSRVILVGIRVQRRCLSPFLFWSWVYELTWQKTHAPAGMILVLLILWASSWAPQEQWSVDALLQSLGARHQRFEPSQGPPTP